MFFWLLFIISCFFVSYIIISFLPKKYRVIIFCLLVTILITPEKLGIGSVELSPAIFTFFFNLLLEDYLSFKTLRPLVFSLPIVLGLSTLIVLTKRKFS